MEIGGRSKGNSEVRSTSMMDSAFPLCRNDEVIVTRCIGCFLRKRTLRVGDTP